MSSADGRETEARDSSKALLFEKVRHLMARERELSALRQEYQRYQTWTERAQRTMAVLSTLSSPSEAIAVLVRALVADTPYEYAGVVRGGVFTEHGIAPSAADRTALEAIARDVSGERAAADARVIVRDEATGETALRWIMSGAVGRLGVEGGVELVLIVARTQRTSGFYQPPWDAELRSFRELLVTIMHAYAAVEYRAALIVDRNKLKSEVELATALLTQTLAETQRARKAAEEASATKSGFLAMVSHELRTPLNAIIAYAELLQDDAEAEGHARRLADVKAIRDAGKHLLAVINSILDMSKIEAGRMELFLETFEIAPLVDEVTRSIRPLLEKRENSFRLAYHGEIDVMHADPIKIRQALYNLLSNACKFTHRGEVALEITITQIADEPYLEFSVRDTGIGMTVEHAAKIFQPFTQADASTSRRYGGSGLGLAISRSFCQLMGGDIEVASREGVGSTFTMFVPKTVTARSLRPQGDPAQP